MLSDKEKNCIKDILLLMQEIDVRNLVQTASQNLFGIKVLSDREKKLY